MRGTHELPVPLPEALGIIPAYAGNTWFRGLPGTIGGDHPRVCGEHDVVNMSDSTDKGSSPRMRGTLVGRGGRCGR